MGLTLCSDATTVRRGAARRGGGSVKARVTEHINPMWRLDVYLSTNAAK
jgi:hypothetical protein